MCLRAKCFFIAVSFSRPYQPLKVIDDGHEDCISSLFALKWMIIDRKLVRCSQPLDFALGKLSLSSRQAEERNEGDLLKFEFLDATLQLAGLSLISRKEAVSFR